MFHNRQWIQIDKSIFTVQIHLHQSSDEEVSWWHRTEPLNLAWLWAVGTCIYTDRKVVRYSMTVQIGTSTWNLRWMQRWTAEHRAAQTLAVCGFAVYTMTKKRQTMRCGLEIWDTSVTSRAYCKYDWQVLWDQTGIWDGKHSGMMVVCKLFILLTFENRCRVCFYVHFWFPGSWVL